MSIASKQITLTLPEIGFIAITRGLLGVGIGLLLSGGLKKRARRVAGASFAAVGLLTTGPILLRLRDELK
jgi:hypothetical protein